MIKRPNSPVEARAMLARAFDANARRDLATTVAFLRAVLATDFLTDRGRADLYWVCADSELQLGQFEAHFSSLGGFLLASDIIEGEREDLKSKRSFARAVLTARKISQEPHFGRSPDAAISLEDAADSSSIFSAIPCGRHGEGRYQTIREVSVERGDEQLELHTARCAGSSEWSVLELWFDVTGTALGR